MLKFIKEIFLQTAKLVFLMVAITVCAAFLIGKLEAKDFIPLAFMAFTAYFVTPTTKSTPTVTPTETPVGSNDQYEGK